MDISSVESSPRVLAVLVTHNGEQWLAECLRSLAVQAYPNLSIVVVDAASEHDVSATVRKLLPRAELLRLDSNVGFGAAANLALESSESAREAEFFLFMHDDVALDESALSLMVATAIDTGAGIVGGKAVGWSHAEELVEVGMSADQLGYPFSGLEEGEIDQGQHDFRREALYVTNACILVSRPLIERCGSWDGTYFAFGEDLDLCYRARLAGFSVYVQAAARFRHAVALAKQLRDAPAVRDIRFYTRRNRLRIITKCAAAYRLPALFGLYLFLTLSELVLLAALRRFGDMKAYPQAFGSFLKSLPDVIRRRRAVQKRRKVPDRRIRRLMVRDIHRARIFLERRLREWETETLELGLRTARRLSPSAIKAIASRTLSQRSVQGLIVITVLALFGMRASLGGSELAAGGFWPFPANPSRLIGDFLAGWRDVGLGTEAAPSPALLIFWLVEVVSMGVPRLAQLVLMVGLMLIGMIGMHRLVARRTALTSAALAAAAFYLLGPVPKALIEAGGLQGLALFAGLPWMLEIGLRILGPTPSEGGDRPGTRITPEVMISDVVRLGLLNAVVLSLAPSALTALLLLWTFTGAWSAATHWDRREGLRRWGWCIATVPAALVLLAPWSFEALRPRGGMLDPLFAGAGGGAAYGGLWAGQSLRYFLFDPAPGLFLAISIPLLLSGAYLVSPAPRRREMRQMMLAWVLFAAIGLTVSKGLVPAPAVSASMWAVVPLAALALIVGHGVAGLREELPRHAVGWRHVVAAASTAAILLTVVGVWVPGLVSWQRPTSTLAAGTGEEAIALNSFFVTTEEQVGYFRVLWLGQEWVDPVRSGIQPADGLPYLLTDPSGLTVRDMYPPPPSAGEHRLEELIAAIAGRRIHLAGHLLAPASIRFIVVGIDDAELKAALGRQRDIALQQQQGSVAIFQNLQWLPRSVLIPSALDAPAKGADEVSQMVARWSGGRAIPATGQGRFEGEIPRTRHPAIVLGDNYNSGWRARVSGDRITHQRAFGWANYFELPPLAQGEVTVSFAGRWIRLLWVVFQAGIVLLAAVMARGGGAETVRAL